MASLGRHCFVRNTDGKKLAMYLNEGISVQILNGGSMYGMIDEPIINDCIYYIET